MDSDKKTGSDFPKAHKIAKRTEILRIQQGGKKIYTPNLLLIYSLNRNTPTRLAITISKKVDKRAVKRNLFKRRVREIFRQYHKFLRSGFDIVVIARKDSAELPYSDLKKDLLWGWKKAELLDSSYLQENKQE